MQKSTAQHSTAQHSTAQHSAAQRSAAQRSAAQHGMAWHSMGWHSTSGTSSSNYTPRGKISPVKFGCLNTAAITSTTSNEGIHSALIGLQPQVEHDAQHAQRTGHLGHIQQGTDEGVEGQKSHLPASEQMPMRMLWHSSVASTPVSSAFFEAGVHEGSVGGNIAVHTLANQLEEGY
ncbi:MAG: hypothetical protein FRX49_10647 [Trebouxia sp. A1-2]|nr:MAG: hypothetical protein FRX49_10647 [Trebouxia sp. A1-2]